MLSCLCLPLPPLPPLPQGSQDSTGGQEGLVAPPFTAFPPPPPPQNGLPGTEFGPGAMFGAGGQGAAEVGAGANGAPTSTNNNSSNVSTTISFPFLFLFIYIYLIPCRGGRTDSNMNSLYSKNWYWYQIDWYYPLSSVCSPLNCITTFVEMKPCTLNIHGKCLNLFFLCCLFFNTLKHI